MTLRDLDLLVAASKDVDEATIESLIASLHPATDADWTRLRAEAFQPDENDHESDELVVSGSFDGGSWTSTLKQFRNSTGRRL